MGPIGNSDTVGILVKTSADDAGIVQTEAGLKSMGDTAKSAGSAGQTSFDSFNKSLDSLGQKSQAVGRSLSEYVTAPLVGIAAESVKSAMSFQQTMEMLHTNAGTAQDAIAGLSQSVLDMASQVGAKPEELAQGLYHIASAGNGIWSTAKQLDILKIAAEGAAIGQANLDDTTYSLTSTMASNIKGAQDASETMATLTAIVGAGDMKMTDLNAAIGTGFLGTAATFGISLQSVGAALATLTDNGEHADAAATRLRMTWALMTSPSKQASEMLGDLGLNASDAAAATDQMNQVFAKTGLTTTKLATDLQQPNGMNVALRDLQTHLQSAGLNAAETDAILSKAFGGGRTDAAMLTMLQNLDRTDEKFQSINSQASQFSEKWADQQETANQQFHDSWAKLEADLIKLGDAVLPEVTKDFDTLARYVQDVSTWFDNLNDTQKTFVIHAAEVAIAAGPALLVFGKFASALSSIGGLLSGVSKGLGLLKFAPLAGEAGEATEALAGGGGLLAALGPVGLGIGAVALAAGGAYLAIKHFDDMGSDLGENIKTQVNPQVQAFQNLAAATGVTIHGTSGEISIMDLDTQHLKDSQNIATAAAKLHDQATQNLANSQKTAAQRASDVATAQAGVKTAYDKFGANSPQYQAAVDNLTSKQDLLDQALAQTATDNINLTIKTGLYHDALNNLNGAVADLTSYQNFLNNQLAGGVGVVAKFGPTALAQVGGIQVLQNSISGIVTSWNGAVANIQNQSAGVNAILFGTQSTIQRIQGQSNTLNATLSAANSSAITLQGSMGNIQGSNMNIQGKHATGTNYSREGWALVGEEGPELAYLPQGSQIKTAPQTSAMMRDMSAGSHSSMGGNSTSQTVTNHQTVSIGQVVLGSADAAEAFFKKYDQDALLLSRGLTANRGMR